MKRSSNGLSLNANVNTPNYKKKKTGCGRVWPRKNFQPEDFIFIFALIPVNIPIDQKLNIHVDRPPPCICMKWFGPGLAYSFSDPFSCRHSQSVDAPETHRPQCCIVKENLVFEKGKREKRKRKDKRKGVNL